MMGIRRWMALLVVVTAMGLTATATQAKPPLKIIFSDWPGWVAYQVGIEKGWFEEAGVPVEFLWFDYGAGLEAFAAGQADAYSATNGDALVIGATAGKPSTCILINDYSNGNDMLIARPGIDSIKELKGKKIGCEVGFVSHLLLLRALRSVGLEESDVELVDLSNDDTPNALKSGSVAAVAAWQPSSGKILDIVPRANVLFTSAQAPGLIYDCLYVDRRSLATRREDWKKFIGVWYRIVDYIKDKDNRAEVLSILGSRVDLPPEEYKPLLKGSYLLPLDEALDAWEKGDTLRSIWGSSEYVDTFNTEHKVYAQPEFSPRYLDPSLTREYAESVK
jgi:NitT/TauT family transport system substrate-binding protein